jgi:hypothetical protein
MRMLRGIVLSLSVAGVVGVIGCGGSGAGSTGGSSGGGGNASAGTTGSAGTSGGGTSGGGTSGGGSGGMLAACGTDTSASSGDTCNSAVADGPCVTVQVSGAAAPTPAGGTITAGTYRLTSATFYGTGGGNQQGDRRQTFVVSAVTALAFTLDQIQTSGTRVDRAHGPVVVSGTTVTFTPTCPPAGDGGDNGGSAQFTATASTFSLFESKNGGTQVSVYTKS